MTDDTLRDEIAAAAPFANNDHDGTRDDDTDELADAIDDLTRTAVAAAIRSNDPLPYLAEFHRADEAAAEVTA